MLPYTLTTEMEAIEVAGGESIEFWKTLAEACGPLTPEARRLVKYGGYGVRYGSLESEEERRELVEEVAAHVRRLAESGVWLGAFSCGLDAAGGPKGDGRWRLLDDLARARGSGAQQTADPAPMTVGVDAAALRVMPSGTRVVVTFDGRLPLDAVQRELRALWPQLRAAGWVQRTRPLAARKLALARFVCLEMPPDTAWRVLCKDWNERHPEWAYANAWAMKSDFHRAEESLTGRKYGLDWHYDPAAREVQEMPPGDLMQKVWTGGLTPRQEKAFHRYAEWMSLALGAGAEG